jgi:hypothetical protein
MRDASAFVGGWPFGLVGSCDIADATHRLGRIGFTAAAISPLDAVLAPDPSPVNQALQSAAQTITGFTVRPIPVINPTLAGWASQIDACPGARAVKILPNYQGYGLDSPAVDDLAEVLAARGMTLCVQLRMLDERSHHKLMPVPAVPAAELNSAGRRHPELSILACGLYAPELEVIADTQNIHAEISFAESGWMPASVLDTFPLDRILLGTHFPIHNPQAAVAKLWPSNITEDTFAQITERNFQRLFG